jgi:hypothetical protein
LDILTTTIVKAASTLGKSRVEQWAKSIADDYENIAKLPKIIKNRIMRTYGALSEMNDCIDRYNHLHKAGFINDAEKEAQRLFSLVDEIKAPTKRAKACVDVDFAIQELKKFTQSHVEKVGMMQAVKDFQVGMNLLNKGRKNSATSSKRQLVEDGDFGEKTLACFCDVCKNYSPRVIKKYIKRGAVKNAIFGTKDNPQIDTDMLVRTICENLKG